MKQFQVVVRVVLEPRNVKLRVRRSDHSAMLVVKKMNSKTQSDVLHEQNQK